MKRLAVIAAACILLVAGCRKAEKTKIHPIPTAVGHGPKSDNPYYYGLIEEYRNMLAADPDNLAALIALGNAYSESGAWREAILQYERALRIEPRNADVRTDMGNSFRNIGMPDRALTEYRKALEYEPGHLGARYFMGVVHAFDYRNYPVAIHVWEELLRLSPNHPNADYMRTNIAMFRKTLKKAQAQR